MVWHCVWQESRIWKAGGRFCAGVSDANLASVAMKMFSCIINFTREMLQMCTFNEIRKYNAATKLLLFNKKYPFSSTLTLLHLYLMVIESKYKDSCLADCSAV
jgi:hypothetical protein